MLKKGGEHRETNTKPKGQGGRKGLPLTSLSLVPEEVINFGGSGCHLTIATTTLHNIRPHVLSTHHLRIDLAHASVGQLGDG